LIDGKFQAAERILIRGKGIGKLVGSKTINELPDAQGLTQKGTAFDAVYGVKGCPTPQVAWKTLSGALHGNETRQRKTNENRYDSSYNHTHSLNKRAGIDPA
jgi:hypothetical protein